ncbi:MAG TPA: class I SAM-dependent methyltransferase [Ilumatobacteraceae bacterium]|jgi:SAM-dependent methyltransferase
MRRIYVPWRAAGTTTELKRSADEVVRDWGWVFNNRTGPELNLAEFVSTGDHETLAYLTAFGLDDGRLIDQTLVEIGSGIGRMTASFSRLFGRVVACDIDGAFLERCRETVAQFGRPERLQTSRVIDGRTLALPDGIADLTFSYITLQHCHRDDALALTSEAVRATRSGGRVALNYRTWTATDLVLWPAGKVVRGLWRLPKIGQRIAKRRSMARLGWQANRLSPLEVLTEVGANLTHVQIFRSPRRRSFEAAGTTDRSFEGVNRSHWWLVATVV